MAVSVDETQVQGKEQGRYAVEYTTDKTSIIVYATVTQYGDTITDPDTGDIIRVSANDFAVESSIVDGLKDADIIALAKAKAINERTGADVDIKVTSMMKNAKGVYDVTFANEKSNATVTVKATVTDAGSSGNTDPAIEHYIYANDFAISVEEAKAITSVDLLKLGNAKASEKASGAPVIISVDEKQVQGKAQGRYALKYTTDKTSITVYVTVTQYGDTGVDSDTGNKIRLTVNDFAVERTKVDGLKDGDLITLAKAKAINEITGDVGIQVTSTMKSTKGIYDVTFTNEKSGATVTVKASVSDNGEANTDPSISESIYTNDFSLTKEEAKVVSEIELINRAKAIAIDVVSGAFIKVMVNVNDVLGKGTGLYDVVFKTKNGTSIVVKANISDNGGATNPDLAVSEAIYANDFSVEQAQVKDLTDKKLIELAKANAVDTNTGANLAITKVTSEIQDTSSIYNVTFETAKSTKVIVEATVKEAEVIKPEEPVNPETPVIPDKPTNPDVPEKPTNPGGGNG